MALVFSGEKNKERRPEKPGGIFVRFHRTFRRGERLRENFDLAMGCEPPSPNLVCFFCFAREVSITEIGLVFKLDTFRVSCMLAARLATVQPRATVCSFTPTSSIGIGTCGKEVSTGGEAYYPSALGPTSGTLAPLSTLE